jgi:prepilin-type N-terminal cleavage/methylation domain-containing protein
MSWLLHLLKSKKGVTLIELLVVVVILGIIAAVAIPAVMSNQATAFANTNDQNLAIVQEAVQRYAIDHDGDYPATLNDLDTEYLQQIPEAHLDTTAGGTGAFDYDESTGVVSKPTGAY